MKSSFSFRVANIAPLRWLSHVTLSSVALIAGCSDASPTLQCGAGTVQAGAECVAPQDASIDDANADASDGGHVQDGDAATIPDTSVDAHVAHCLGTPTPCDSISDAVCLNQPGCRGVGSCTGGGSCGSNVTGGQCIGKGCTWVTACGGATTGTCTETTEAECVAVTGCSWK